MPNQYPFERYAGTRATPSSRSSSRTWHGRRHVSRALQARELGRPGNAPARCRHRM